MVTTIATLSSHLLGVFGARYVWIDCFTFYVIAIADFLFAPHVASWEGSIHKILNICYCHRVRIIENPIINNASSLKICGLNSCRIWRILYGEPKKHHQECYCGYYFTEL